MSLSSIISGVVIFIFGLGFLIFNKNQIFGINLIIGIVAIALGLYMVINSKNEDKIEQIKTKK